MEAKGYIFRQVRILLLVATAVNLTACSLPLYDFEWEKKRQAAIETAYAELKKNPEEWRENTVKFLASQCVLVLQDKPIDREAFLQAGYLEYTNKRRTRYKHFIEFQPWISGFPDRKGCYVRQPKSFNKYYVQSLVEDVFLQNGFVRLPNEKGKGWPRYKADNLTVENRTGYFRDWVTFFVEIID
jgi:hypothetical protein